MNKPAITKNMWAPIRIGQRGDWVIYSFIRYTRREAKAAFLENWGRADHKHALADVRFARVTITEETNHG